MTFLRKCAVSLAAILATVVVVAGILAFSVVVSILSGVIVVVLIFLIVRYTLSEWIKYRRSRQN